MIQRGNDHAGTQEDVQGWLTSADKKTEHTPDLLAFIDSVFFSLECPDAPDSVRAITMHAARILNAIAGRSIRVGDLNAQAIATLSGIDCGPFTGIDAEEGSRRRECITAVWKYAVEIGYAAPHAITETQEPLAAAKPAAAELEPAGSTGDSSPPESTLLADVIEMTLEKPMSEGCAYNYRNSIRCLSEFLGRDAKREDLSEPVINGWLRSLEGTLHPTTIHKRKTNLTPVWNWLAEQDKVPSYNHRRLRRTACQWPVVRAWTTEQVSMLLHGAADVEGRLKCGLKGSDTLRALILLAFDSGLRPGDIYRIRFSEIDCETKTFRVVQNKVKRQHSGRLNAITIKAIQRLNDGNRERVFPIGKDGFRYWTAKLYEAAAAYGFTRRHREGVKTLRKTHATERTRCDSPEAAARSLGHRHGSKVAQDHYIDPDAIQPLEALECVSLLTGTEGNP